ncbi:MAG TPA: hypothetical protein VKF61_01940 [Candidatus Polarisedimenticolia bacterium]|nr:hypothetical protein [Candidatus Polarisedimenticolia bacterium]
MRDCRFGWVAVYALAMAYVEAAVVVYLRRVFGVVDLVRDTAIYDPRIAAIEFGREAATLLMLLAVGFLAGRSRQGRLGFALYAFAVWDILYYVWLKLLIGWPESLLTQDVLFLIPLPWWGPVLAPVLVALLLLGLGAILVVRDDQGMVVRLGRLGWGFFLAGVLLVLYAFMADAIGILPAGAEALSRLKPGPFRWSVYLAGLGAMSISVWRAARRRLA